MTRRRGLPLALALASAAAMALPSHALGQASVGNGSAASEYGDYVPTTSGRTSTPHTSPPPARHSTPRRTYTPPPVRHYYAPPRRTYTAPAPTRTYIAPAAPRGHAHKPHRKHAAHGAARAHHVSKVKPAASKPRVVVPSSPAASVDGGSHQLVWLGLAMISMTVAVFARAGWRRRHGSV